jgi:hypothetical protein
MGAAKPQARMGPNLMFRRLFTNEIVKTAQAVMRRPQAFQQSAMPSRVYE